MPAQHKSAYEDEVLLNLLDANPPKEITINVVGRIMKRHFRIHRSSVLVGLLVGVALAATAEEARAGFTFLGPTPYLSAADSPFAEYLDGPDFYLEDFEDEELNTPGIFQPVQDFPIGTRWQGAVVPPGELTDSVDGDDGMIDGSGNAGYSFGSGAHLVLDMFPLINNLFIDFEFDENVLGYLPNAFGFVWTDGPPGIAFGNGLEFRIDIIDGEGNRTFSDAIRPVGDMMRNGNTEDDSFLGTTNSNGISRVSIRAVFFGETDGFEYFEIDHVQYGFLQIPEPSGSLIGISAMVVLVCGRLPHFARKAKEPTKIDLSGNQPSKRSLAR